MSFSIHDAVIENNFDMVQRLLKNGADVNTKNKYGDTALMNACENKDLDIIRYLCENMKSHVWCSESREKFYKYNSIEIIKYLYENKHIPKFNFYEINIVMKHGHFELAKYMMNTRKLIDDNMIDQYIQLYQILSDNKCNIMLNTLYDSN